MRGSIKILVSDLVHLWDISSDEYRKRLLEYIHRNQSAEVAALFSKAIKK